jgi:hypothetical protein
LENLTEASDGTDWSLDKDIKSNNDF